MTRENIVACSSARDKKTWAPLLRPIPVNRHHPDGRRPVQVALAEEPLVLDGRGGPVGDQFNPEESRFCWHTDR